MAKKDEFSTAYDFFGDMDAGDSDESGELTVESLQKQVKDLQGRLETREKPRYQFNAEEYVIDAPPDPIEPDFDSLPDQYENPVEYRKAMKRIYAEAYRANKELDAQYADYVAGQTQKREALVQNLWNDFNQKYPQYADAEKQIKWAADKVAAEKSGRGINMTEYVFGSPDDYFNDIAATVKEMWPELGKEAEADPDVKDRTDVLSGTGFPGKPGKEAPEPKGDMIKDLHKLQSAGRLY